MQYSSLRFSNCSAVLLLQKKKKYKSTQVPALRAPATPGTKSAGAVRCSVWAAASQGHRDSSAARIHQHRLPGICPLPAEGTEKGKSSKNGHAQGSCVLGYSGQHEVCQLFSYSAQISPHHIPVQLDWEPWAQPPSPLLEEATTWKLRTQRGVVPLALPAPARSITAGHPQHLPGCSHSGKTSTTAGLPSSSKVEQVNESSLFWKGIFYSPDQNLHFAAP